MAPSTYSASREICEVSTSITTERPQTVIRPNDWGGIDFDLTRHNQPRVRLAVEDEEGAIALYVFDASGLQTANATFSNMPAPVIEGVVRAHLA